MQGLSDFIPTRKKADYINQLLKVGFDTIDFGSFVSPKAIPQLKDTAEVLSLLDLSETQTKLLAIVANYRGAIAACLHPQIHYIGYPFSISETFQLRNTNASIGESFAIIEDIQELCILNKKELVVYISMAFGNPYGDEWSAEIVHHWIKMLSGLDIKIFAMSDTIGVSTPDNIEYIFKMLIPKFKNIEIGAHFHSRPANWSEKLEAAAQSGCTRFDGAIRGYGGCPMAKDDLIGNMATEQMIGYLDYYKYPLNIDHEAFKIAMEMAAKIFP
jgi:hydroxymethylglutaryl-CoA lyase